MGERTSIAEIAIPGGVGAFAGIVLAIMLMAAPTGTLWTSGCGPSTLVRSAGFDPWTGQPQGQIVQGWCMGHAYVTDSPIPNALLGHRGLPWASLLTLGFAIGGLVAGWVVATVNQARRGPVHTSSTDSAACPRAPG